MLEPAKADLAGAGGASTRVRLEYRGVERARVEHGHGEFVGGCLCVSAEVGGADEECPARLADDEGCGVEQPVGGREDCGGIERIGDRMCDEIGRADV